MYTTAYVHNPHPRFIMPKHGKKRPFFLQWAIQRSVTIDVARHPIHYTIQPRDPITGKIQPRFRRLNEHRARALRAIVPAMLYFCNIASTLVMASVEQLSDHCGLSTYSAAGNKSITRTSRLITHFLEPMGFVTCEKVWDNILGTYLPKMIFLKPLFFMLLDISEKKWNDVRTKQLDWINRERKKKNQHHTTWSNIVREAKEQHVQCAFAARRLRHISYKQKKRAMSIIQWEEQKARSYILNILVQQYSTTELCKMGVQKLKEKVSREYYKLQKIARTL